MTRLRATASRAKVTNMGKLHSYGVGFVGTALAVLLAVVCIAVGVRYADAATTTTVTGGTGTVVANGQAGGVWKPVHFTHTLTSETYGTGIAWTRATIATSLGCAEVLAVVCGQETGAYHLRYDSTDQEIEAFEVSGAALVEESTTSTAISGRLGCIALCR